MTFYLEYICHHIKKEFPNTISYNFFVERQTKVAMNLLLFFQFCALGKCSGIFIIDSTPLISCHIKRAHNHKAIKGWAQKGKCTKGCFYRFKLHFFVLVIFIKKKGGKYHPCPFTVCQILNSIHNLALSD